MEVLQTRVLRSITAAPCSCMAGSTPWDLPCTTACVYMCVYMYACETQMRSITATPCACMAGSTPWDLPCTTACVCKYVSMYVYITHTHSFNHSSTVFMYGRINTITCFSCHAREPKPVDTMYTYTYTKYIGQHLEVSITCFFCHVREPEHARL